MINKIYSHLTKEWKIKRVVDEIERLENQQTKSTTNAKELIEIGKEQGKQEKENEDVKECKDVLLNFLFECLPSTTKEDYKRVNDANTIDKLNTLVYCYYYKPFEKMGIDIEELKNIYKSEQDKVKTLKEKIQQAKERIQAEKDINTM